MRAYTKPGSVRVECVVYRGITFRRYPDAKKISHRRYYSPGGQEIKRGVDYLHREIWKDAHGPIPAGCDIHHRDENPDNNDLANLECLTVAEHRRRHAETCEYYKSEKMRENLARIRPQASEWHRSEEGREWHRQNGARAMAMRRPVKKTCKVCGRDFWTIFLGPQRFCSQRCCDKARPPRPQGPMTTCPECKAEFRIKNAQKPAVCCSRACGVRYRYRLAKGGSPEPTTGI